jgi:hypothetical protein
MLVGHSRLLLWFSVCKPSHHLLHETPIHHDAFVRIAIWNHKRFVTFLAVGVWLIGLALNIYSTFLFPGHARCDLNSCACMFVGLTTVCYTRVLILDLLGSHVHKKDGRII